ncbi:MAG: alternative ribosome rescue aminoacyl-tRNA hydrolase ArfB [Candidatus Tectomicrobia bacterium]|nr:alternative ribosome rescue aminoacyl-tRNA hydrolase ArfB [Candidatus Tectomicrobia bacterium]
MVAIMDDVAIAEQELTFTASRSRGPGGQNVNKVNSRVMLQFNVAASPSLSEAQKQQIRTRLANRVSEGGVLQVVSQASRSQAANRQTAMARLTALIREALTPTPMRKASNVPVAAKQRRLEAKRHRSQLKRQRQYRTNEGG